MGTVGFSPTRTLEVEELGAVGGGDWVEVVG